MPRIQSVLLCAAALFANSILAADSGPKDDVLKAAKALAEKGNYSWKSTVTVPPDAQFRPGPTEGKTDKDGGTYVTMSGNNRTTEAAMKGKKTLIKTEENGWQTLDEMENAEGFGRFLAARMRGFKAPAEQAEEIVKDVKDLKKEGDAYSGDLTEEGAKNLMRFRRGGNGDGPQISGAKGSAKFWVKDGVLSKYEFKVKGSMNFNGNDIDMDRTTTTEIKDVGTTKVSIPEGAQKKLSS
jgi:hypothetical protein